MASPLGLLLLVWPGHSSWIGMVQGESIMQLDSACYSWAGLEHPSQHKCLHATTPVWCR